VVLRSLVVGVRVGEVGLGELEEEREEAKERVEDARVNLFRERLDFATVRVEEGEVELLVLERVRIFRLVQHLDIVSDLCRVVELLGLAVPEVAVRKGRRKREAVGKRREGGQFRAGKGRERVATYCPISKLQGC
jgi:hypothetical protein